MVSHMRDLSDTKSLKNKGTDLNLDQLVLMTVCSQSGPSLSGSFTSRIVMLDLSGSFNLMLFLSQFVHFS